MKIILKIVLIIFLLQITACNLQKINTKNPIAADDNMQLGLAYLQQGDRARAKHKLLLAMQQDKNSAQVQDAMAYFLEVTGETKQAESRYLIAIQLAPHSGAEHNNYGAFLCRIGKYSESEQQFLAAIHDPDYLNTAKAYENAGLCALKIPDNKTAEGFFMQAVNHDPSLSFAWYQLAQISYDAGDQQLAQQYMANYLRLTEINSGN